MVSGWLKKSPIAAMILAALVACAVPPQVQTRAIQRGTQRTGGVPTPTFRVVDRGSQDISSGGPVIKGQVFDAKGDLIRNGRAEVGVTVEGIFVQTDQFPNPFPTNPDGWYEIYVESGQVVRIAQLWIDGEEVVLEGTSAEWEAAEGRWWQVDVRVQSNDNLTER